MKPTPYRHRPKGLTILYRKSQTAIELLTGIKNQIRVHFSEKRHPLVGDDKYGKKGGTKSRLALHSRYLTFKHPHSGKELTFEAEVPVFFKSYFDNI